MGYDHKDEQLCNAKGWVEEAFDNLHPTDRVEAFGELSEWASQRRDGREQINARDGAPDRPVDTFTDVAKEASKRIENAYLDLVSPGGSKASADASWDTYSGDIMEDMRKAKAAIKADTGFKPTFDVMGEAAKKYYDQAVMAQRGYAHQYIGTPIEDIRDEEVVKALKHEPTTMGGPLYVIGESVSWAGLDDKRVPGASFPRALVTCLCKGLIGVWYKVDDRVRVQRSHGVGEGRVIMVRHDNTVDVLLDDKAQVSISPKEAAAQVAIRSGVPEMTATRITVKADSVDICRGCAYVKTGSGYVGTYIGCVVSENDDGTVTIEVRGVKPYDPNYPLPVDVPAVFDRDGQQVITDEAVLDAIRNKKRVCDLLTADDVASYDAKWIPDKVSPNADAAPCEECKGAGTWINPFNDEASPCSRGCKS